jgi:hypothetical protein
LFEDDDRSSEAAERTVGVSGDSPIVSTCLLNSPREFEFKFGSLIEPRGSLIELVGSLIEPRGSLIELVGSLIEPRGSLIEPRGWSKTTV